MAEIRIFLDLASAANCSEKARQFCWSGPAPLLSKRFHWMEPKPCCCAQFRRSTFASVKNPIRIFEVWGLFGIWDLELGILVTPSVPPTPSAWLSRYRLLQPTRRFLPDQASIRAQSKRRHRSQAP